MSYHTNLHTKQTDLAWAAQGTGVVWLCLGLTAQGCHGAYVSCCSWGSSQSLMVNRPAAQCSCSGLWFPLCSANKVALIFI
jgi:hypothetical protein